jgi:hypothetical protein
VADIIFPTALLVIGVVALGAFLLYIFRGNSGISRRGDEQLLKILARCWTRPIISLVWTGVRSWTNHRNDDRPD